MKYREFLILIFFAIGAVSAASGNSGAVTNPFSLSL
jgi:hypothetical protein